MTAPVTPFSLKDAPALIERLLPVQKLSAEAYKEQEARQSKTLTPLGSYWKGRKPRRPPGGRGATAHAADANTGSAVAARSPAQNGPAAVHADDA